MRVHGQTQRDVMFKDPDIHKNTLLLSTSPAINDTLRAFRPTSGTSSLNSVEIRYAATEMFARERRLLRSPGNRVVVGEVRKTTTISLSTCVLCRFGVHEPNLVEIRLAVLEILTYRYTDKHTCKHLSSLYVLASRPGIVWVTLDKVELGLRIFYIFYVLKTTPIHHTYV